MAGKEKEGVSGKETIIERREDRSGRSPEWLNSQAQMERREDTSCKEGDGWLVIPAEIAQSRVKRS